MFGEGNDGGRGHSIRGALFILAVGITLGVTYNALALSGRPPRGIPWIDKGPTPTPTLESLQPGAVPGATPAPAAPAPLATDATGVPMVPDLKRPIDLELVSLKKLYDAGAVLIVDARDKSVYNEGHIAGAVSLPYNDALADPTKVAKLDPGGKPIAIYCSGIHCDVSLELANVLVDSGKRRVLVFKGGYPEWEAAGYPIVKGIEPGARP